MQQRLRNYPAPKKKEGIKTNYQENNTNYINRNQGRNSGRFERRGRDRSRSSYRGGNYTERFKNPKDEKFYRSRSQGDRTNIRNRENRSQSYEEDFLTTQEEDIEKNPKVEH